MALAIVVAIVAQLIRASDNETFSPVNFFSYFTILSNLGAIIVLGTLAARPALIGREPFVVLRGAGPTGTRTRSSTRTSTASARSS